MIVSEAGKQFIKQWEQCRLHAYPDPGTGGAPWTCGWGSTGSDISNTTQWSQGQADARFESEISVLQYKMEDLIQVAMTQNEFDSCASISFNIGIGNFRSSTLLRKLNAGDKDGCSAEFLRWNRAAGKVMAGLVRRRKAEHDLFLTAGVLIAA